jgi:8-oxo-dGTP pyrophosphatase MutT (NUDIX family)
MNYAGAGFILLSSDLTHILLVHDTRSGKWGFPKGHREKYDSNDLATAMRECREETGLTSEHYKFYNETFKLSRGRNSYIFRYAILKNDMWMKDMIAGPAHEIAGLEWVPLSRLIDAQNILDGNKYLRAWIEDIQTNSSKRYVSLFKSLVNTFQTLPSQETMSSCNIVTCI